MAHEKNYRNNQLSTASDPTALSAGAPHQVVTTCHLLYTSLPPHLVGQPAELCPLLYTPRPSGSPSSGGGPAELCHLLYTPMALALCGQQRSAPPPGPCFTTSLFLLFPLETRSCCLAQPGLKCVTLLLILLRARIAVLLCQAFFFFF